MTEVMGRLNLTRDTIGRVAGVFIMMTEAWVPAGVGTPENPMRPVGVSDGKEQIWMGPRWMSPMGHDLEHCALF